MNAKATKKIEALGVGGLFFVRNEQGELRLLLFKEVNDGEADRDSGKLERLVQQGKQDVFSTPRGLNTVTGKVDHEKAVKLMQANQGLSIELQAILVETLLREITEEAYGLADLTPQHIHYFSQSPILAEQIRPVERDSDNKILVKFTVFVLAVLLNPKDIANLEREYQLFDLQELNRLNLAEVRKATLATFDFVVPALLFLAREGRLNQIETNLLSNNHQELASVFAN